MSGDPEGFKAAAGGFREYNLPFWLAVTLLEHVELTRRAGQSLDEARHDLRAARRGTVARAHRGGHTPDRNQLTSRRLRAGA